ncbi:hypothetical protein MUP77_04795, partial [Candidatus Bathyarchaeota archaeon]|nr:hypothetical protein [Candidatus Bathyarchaeota archaeon]
LRSISPNFFQFKPSLPTTLAIPPHLMRKGLNWRGLGEGLRSSEKDFGNLREERFQTINFKKDKISDSITTIYGKLDPLPYLGSPTTISKTLHALNPEIFVMWDTKIREKYRNKNSRVRDNPEGYLEFLKETQKEIRDALNDRKKETGKGLDEIEKEIRNKYKNITLAKIIDEHNWVAVHPRKKKNSQRVPLLS